MIDWVVNTLYFSIFFVCLCRLKQLSPEETLASVAAYYFAVGLGAFLAMLAHIAGATEWPQWAMLGDVLFPIGVLVALLIGTWRWWFGAPKGVKK